MCCRNNSPTVIILLGLETFSTSVVAENSLSSDFSVSINSLSWQVGLSLFLVQSIFSGDTPLGRKKPLLKPLPPSRVTGRSVADSPSGSTPPSGHHHNGSVSRNSVPVRQTDREEEIASRVLASHAQPFCNVQHITEIHTAYYQRHTFWQLAGPGIFRHQTAILSHIFTSPADALFQSIWLSNISVSALCWTWGTHLHINAWSLARLKSTCRSPLCP